MNKINKFISVVLSVSIILLSFFIIDVYADTIKSGNLSKDENMVNLAAIHYFCAW